MKFFNEAEQSVVFNAIAALAYACSTLNSENFTCFFQYSGHVQQAGITVFKDGWEENVTGEQFSLYCSPEWETPESIVKRAKQFIKILETQKEESDLRWSTANRKASLIAIEEAKLKAAKLALAELNKPGPCP